MRESFHAGQRRLAVKNDSGETAPAFAALQVTGYDLTEDCVTVGKPDADSLSVVLANGPADIPAGRKGVATADGPFVVLYDDADAPAAGDAWGTVSGSWELGKGKTGLIAWGGAEDGRAVFMPAGGSGLGEDENLRVTGAGTTAGGITYYPAKLKTWSGGVAGESTEDVWLFHFDTAVTLDTDKLYHGRKYSGGFDVGGTTRAVYGTVTSYPDDGSADNPPVPTGVDCVGDELVLVY